MIPMNKQVKRYDFVLTSYIPLNYEVSRILPPLGIPRRVLEWWPGMIVDLFPPPL